MKNLLKMMPSNPSYLVLSLLMVVFIVLEVAPPSNVCMLVDTIVGKAVVIMVALSLFSLDMLMGIVGIVAAYVLIMRCSKKEEIRTFSPSEVRKSKHLSVMNQFPQTVEEEIIGKMLPRTNPDLQAPDYKPTLNNLHNATKL
jgi:hypothetical protein|tara:strand:- start:33 stop:458 length:426 start_codon:yes stop_codon:yes gene_type:complete